MDIVPRVFQIWQLQLNVISQLQNGLHTIPYFTVELPCCVALDRATPGLTDEGVQPIATIVGIEEPFRRVWYTHCSFKYYLASVLW